MPTSSLLVGLAAPSAHPDLPLSARAGAGAGGQVVHADGFHSEFVRLLDRTPDQTLPLWPERLRQAVI